MGIEFFIVALIALIGVPYVIYLVIKALRKYTRN